jgi:hypothetical protein
MSGLTFDSGALIAFERADRKVVALVARTLHHGELIGIPAGVVAQSWRDGRRQARLARLLASRTVEIEPLDDREARASGQLCGARGTNDVVDASVVLSARRRGGRVVTSDAEDLLRLDPTLSVIEV